MKRYFLFIICILPVFIFSINSTSNGNYSTFSRSSKPLIVLDAGHGGRDQGAKIKYPHCEEKRLALTTVHLTKKYLEQLGYRVILTRSKDFFITLQRRVYIANKANCELFVSVHFNSCPNKSARGIEIYYKKSSKQKKRMFGSYNLAKSILNKTSKRTGFKSRGVKEGNFCVIRETKMPAVLVEGGFITNPLERECLRKREYLDKLSKGIAEGINSFIQSH